MRERGFTLIELTVVIVITGILAATLTVFLKPIIEGYFDTRRRADLTDMADTALRRMAKDIRSAVPNSIWASENCFQLVPTIAGGRYRVFPDTTDGNSKAIDTASYEPTKSFDVLSMLGQVPVQKNDWVVIDNQHGEDVYKETNRAAIDSIENSTTGAYRINLKGGGKHFPEGYDGGRFVIVPDAEKTVFYSCVGNTLYRKVELFDADRATACAQATGAVVATDVADCTFVYNPNQGATQQSGFVWMQLKMGRPGNDENFALSYGVHVDNVP